MNVEERIAQLNERDRNGNLAAAKRNVATDIYENTNDEIVEPGYYEVTETDHGGMRDEAQFLIRITKPINLKELALNLYEDLGYVSPWRYLSIRYSTPKVRKTY